MVAQHSTIITQLLEKLGYIINWKKLEIQPSLTLTYLGCNFSLITGRISITKKTVGPPPRIGSQVPVQRILISTAVAVPPVLPDLHRETRSHGYATPEGDPRHFQESWWPCVGRQSNLVPVPKEAKEA